MPHSSRGWTDEVVHAIDYAAGNVVAGFTTSAPPLRVDRTRCTGHGIWGCSAGASYQQARIA